MPIGDISFNYDDIQHESLLGSWKDNDPDRKKVKFAKWTKFMLTELKKVDEGNQYVNKKLFLGSKVEYCHFPGLNMDQDSYFSRK